MRSTARLATVVAGALAVAGCASDPGPTLADLGAEDLAGQNGAALDDRCSTLPVPEGTVTIGCADGAGTSVARERFEAGTYAVVLLCESPGSVTLRSRHPVGLFDDVVVDCAEGPDPAVARVLTLDEPTQVALETVRDTPDASATLLVRED